MNKNPNDVYTKNFILFFCYAFPLSSGYFFFVDIYHDRFKCLLFNQLNKVAQQSEIKNFYKFFVSFPG